MRVVALIIASVAAYAGAVAFMDYVLHVAEGSHWFWMPFVFSGGVLAGGLFFGFRRAPKSPAFITATALASSALVFAVDIAIAVVYSCAKGVCI